MVLSTQTVLACLAVTMLSSSCTSVAPAWQSLDRRDPGGEELAGVWENPATGHLTYFRPDSTEVFHRLGDFCIRDNGVVPSYSLYRFGETGDELLLHYYDYRDRPELLQAPLVFRRSGALPDACRTEVVDGQTDPAKLFEVLAEMLGPLNDGHVNLTWSDRSFNAGRPRLRARLRDAWEASESELSEGAFVSAWHRGVLESVYGVLDPGSLRSGAASAIEWGTIGDTVGYVRINRFSGFTEGSQPRPASTTLWLRPCHWCSRTWRPLR